MGIDPGTRLGAYEVVGAIGAGGMGEVYRARDTKLGREVALKVLPEEFSLDPERMGRFEREAKVLASLNHPNIAAIYGFEDSAGVHALAMELVEGPTLGDLIAMAPLRVEDALPIARQIAEGLEYAHERGIVHRDLKPANVKITPEGTVKILDFGLAKALEGETAGGDISSSPTMSRLATQAGIILGTAAYMSPEQAKGRPVDRRADIWAFGCVLYEMLSGRKAFEGETISDVLAAVIRAEPDWSALSFETLQPVRNLLHRSLKKDTKQRLQAIGEARIAIEETLSGEFDVGAGLKSSPKEQAVERTLPIRRALPWAVGGILICLAALVGWGLGVRNAAPAPQESPVLAYVPPPPNTTFRDFGFGAGPVAVSPGGRKLAFSAADRKGTTKLWVVTLADDRARPIAGTEDAAMPFWSPDGSSVGFFADEKLKTVNLDNGSVQVLTDASCPGGGGAWSPSGAILFDPRCSGPLNMIAAAGGKPRPVTKIESGELTNTLPAALRDGRHFLYMSFGPHLSPSIWMGSLGSDERKLVLKGADLPQFASGHLLFVRDNRVFAQPFDPATGKLSGEAKALAGAKSYSVSGGVLAYQGGTQKGRLEWFDRSGNELGNVGPVAKYFAARISPDGKRILATVVDRQQGQAEQWSYPASGGPATRLTYGPGGKRFSVWSPDGKYIAFSCRYHGKLAICRKPADGSGAAEHLITLGSGVARVNVVDWSPDGRYVSFDEIDNKTSLPESWVLPLFGDRKPFQPAPVSAEQFGIYFSPDGHWVTYFSYESGRPEVYVVPFPGRGGKFQISQNGGWMGMWDRKGHLYFVTMGNRLMEADLAFSGGSVRLKALHPLFQLSLPSFSDPFYDVSADGNRFLVVTSADPSASRFIGVLLNWQSKLRGKK